MKVKLHPDILKDLEKMDPEGRKAFQELFEKIQKAAAESSNEEEFNEKLSELGVPSPKRVEVDDEMTEEQKAEIQRRIKNIPTEH